MAEEANLGFIRYDPVGVGKDKYLLIECTSHQTFIFNNHIEQGSRFISKSLFMKHSH